MKNYDYIIIGAGLAGTTLGLELLKQNKRVLIIEKQDIKKRAKLCGGLLTKKAYKLLSSIIDIDEINITKYNNPIFHNGDKSFSLNLEIFTLNRVDLDNYLFNLYLKKGGKIITGATFSSIDIFKNVITVEKREYSYKYLIGADGINSTLREFVTHRQQRKHLALEVKDVPRKDIELYFMKDFKGYAWIIPNYKYSMIGIGEIKKGEKSITYVFDEYLKQLGIKDKDIRGAFLPSGDDFFFNYQNIFFIGDSAGLASPLTREGIYYALLSAKILSENFNKNYQRKMRKYLVNLYISKFYGLFVYSPFWRNLVFNYHNFFLFRFALNIFFKIVL